MATRRLRQATSNTPAAPMPPTHIVTAANDPLRGEGEAVGGRLRGQGVPVATHRAPGLIHGFLSMDIVPAAAHAVFELAATALRSALLS